MDFIYIYVNNKIRRKYFISNFSQFHLFYSKSLTKIKLLPVISWYQELFFPRLSNLTRTPSHMPCKEIFFKVTIIKQNIGFALIVKYHIFLLKPLNVCSNETQRNYHFFNWSTELKVMFLRGKVFWEISCLSEKHFTTYFFYAIIWDAYNAHLEIRHPAHTKNNFLICSRFTLHSQK